MASPNSPRKLRAGLAAVDPTTGAVLRLIPLQYNPDALTRSVQAQAPVGEGAERSEPLRLKGPPVETFKLEAEFDATEHREFPEQNPNSVKFGLLPELCALETLLYPASNALQAQFNLSRAGSLEIVPTEGPLILFLWGKNRVIPVAITEYSVTEENFDQELNPLQAKVSLSLRVLSVSDLGFDHRGGGLYLAYQQAKERLGRLNPGGSLAIFGNPALS